MLVAQERWLPQYRAHIPAARKRLADHEARGTRVKPIHTSGAVRKPIKSIEELRVDAGELSWIGGAGTKTIDRPVRDSRGPVV